MITQILKWFHNAESEINLLDVSPSGPDFFSQSLGLSSGR